MIVSVHLDFLFLDYQLFITYITFLIFPIVISCSFFFLIWWK